jgi:hypothetical protein
VLTWLWPASRGRDVRWKRRGHAQCKASLSGQGAKSTKHPPQTLDGIRSRPSPFGQSLDQLIPTTVWSRGRFRLVVLSVTCGRDWLTNGRRTGHGCDDSTSSDGERERAHDRAGRWHRRYALVPCFLATKHTALARADLSWCALTVWNVELVRLIQAAQPSYGVPSSFPPSAWPTTM